MGSFLNIVTDLAGEVNITPRLIRIYCDYTFAQITATNFLKPSVSQGFQFLPTDIACVVYGDNVQQFFSVSVTASGDITLVPMSGDVALPVVANHIAIFSNTSGALTDDATTAINGGNLQAGLSGTAGYLASFPGTAAKGSLRVQATANTGDTITTITNAAMGQASTLTIPDPGQSTGSILVSKAAADPGANLISFDVTVGQAALASGGSVTLYTSSGSKQYKIRELYMNAGGTNFSGGGGDRLGQITDNTTVYSVIPAASLQTLANERWGNTGLPLPASAALNTSTVAGASLVFKYSGGTTDYTAGSVVISGILERVA